MGFYNGRAGGHNAAVIPITAIHECSERMGGGSPHPTVVGVKSCQFGGGESVEPFPSISSGGVGVDLGATLHNVGANPDGLAGRAVGCDVVECHWSVSVGLKEL